MTRAACNARNGGNDLPQLIGLRMRSLELFHERDQKLSRMSHLFKVGFLAGNDLVDFPLQRIGL